MILTLDFASDIPIYQQIRNAIVLGIADGTFMPGEKLPTVRALAQEAGINSMTVNKAYQLLKQEGYIITDRRNGAMVREFGSEAQEGSSESRAKEDRGAWEICRLTRQMKMKRELELLVAEAKLGGITEEELADMMREIYRRK